VIKSFKENAIDGSAFFALTEAEVKGDLGATRLGDRKKILARIAEGPAQQGAAPVAPAKPASGGESKGEPYAMESGPSIAYDAKKAAAVADEDISGLHDKLQDAIKAAQPKLAQHLKQISALVNGDPVRWVVPWKQLLAWFDSPDKQLNAVKDAMNYVSRAFFWLEDCFKYSEAKKTVLAVWPTRVIRLALFPNFRDLESEEKMGPHAGVNWSNMMGLRFHEGVLEMVNCKDGPFAYSQPGSMSENTWRSVPLLETLGPKIPLTLWRQTEAEPNKNQLALALTTLRDALGDAKADFATDWGAMCPHVKMNKEYIPRDFYATIERVADGFKRRREDPMQLYYS